MKTKIYFLLFALLTSSIITAQKLEKIDTLTYKKMESKEEGKNFKMGMDINVYVASDKNSYKVGDTLVLGNPTGESSSAFSKKRNFNYIFYGKPAGALLKGMRYVEEEYQDYKVKIEKIPNSVSRDEFVTYFNSQLLEMYKKEKEESLKEEKESR